MASGEFKPNKKLPGQLTKVLSDSVVDLLLAGETMSSDDLYPGHGEKTKTLKKSLHGAAADYNWSGDDVIPSPSAPDRRGKKFNPTIVGKWIIATFGSGVRYALIVHQGSLNFIGYHYITKFIPEWKKILPGIVKKNSGKRR